MFRIIRYIFYLAVIGAGLLLWWFLPKYNYVHKNPQYCAKLGEHFYYCGTETHLEKFFDIIKK